MQSMEILQFVACDSLVWQGTTYNTTGLYHDTLQTSVGCDSVISLNLTINNASTGDTTATACDSIVWYGTHIYINRNLIDIHRLSTGCDSVIH